MELQNFGTIPPIAPPCASLLSVLHLGNSHETSPVIYSSSDELVYLSDPLCHIYLYSLCLPPSACELPRMDQIKSWTTGSHQSHVTAEMAKEYLNTACQHPREFGYVFLAATVVTWAVVVLFRRFRSRNQASIARPRTPDVEKPPGSPIGSDSKSKFAMKEPGGV